MKGLPVPPRRVTGALLVVGEAVLCLAAALLLLRGEALPLGAIRVEDLRSDYGLLTWDLWATTEAVVHGRSVYRTDLLFHPLGSGLAAHTLGPGFVPVGIAARLALANDATYPLYAHRVSIVLCFALGLALARRAFLSLGAAPLPALAAAVGWVSAACWALILANQTLASACALVPAVTLLCVRLARVPSVPRACALAAALAGGVYFSEYFAVFIALAVAALALAASLRAGTREPLRRVAAGVGLRGLALAAAVALLVSLPFLLAWRDSEVRAPGARQVYAGGANLASFVCPNPATTPLYASGASRWLHERITRGSGPFLGVPTLLLAACGIAWGERRLRFLLGTTAALFLALSLGPALRVFGWRAEPPMPYAALMHLPVLDKARDPQRLAVLGIFLLLCLAATGLTGLCARSARRSRVAGTLVGLAALGWWACEGYRPGTVPRAFTPPPQLRQLPQGAVANLPLSITDGGAMFLQVFHGRPIVSGYVSRGTQAQFEHVSRLQAALDESPQSFVSAASALGVRTLILQPGLPEDTATALRRSGLAVVDLTAGLTVETQAGGGRERRERGLERR